MLLPGGPLALVPPAVKLVELSQSGLLLAVRPDVVVDTLLLLLRLGQRWLGRRWRRRR